MLQSLNERPVTARISAEPEDRENLVKEMANHLVAGILNGLDSSNDIDVIDYLWKTPERYQSRVILNHLDSAMYEAKQTLLAMEMSQP